MNADLIQQLVKMVAENNQNMLEMREEFRYFDTKLDNRFNEINARIDDVNTRLDNLQSSVDRIEMTQQEEVIGLLKLIAKHKESTDYRIDSLNKRVHIIESQIEKLTSQ